jgi:hypothetical protein
MELKSIKLDHGITKAINTSTGVFMEIQERSWFVPNIPISRARLISI